MRTLLEKREQHISPRLLAVDRLRKLLERDKGYAVNMAVLLLHLLLIKTLVLKGAVSGLE